MNLISLTDVVVGASSRVRGLESAVKQLGGAAHGVTRTFSVLFVLDLNPAGGWWWVAEPLDFPQHRVDTSRRL